MFIHLQTEFIAHELPAELTKIQVTSHEPILVPPVIPDPLAGTTVPANPTVVTPYVLTDDMMVAAGWYRFTIDAQPIVLPGYRLTYTRTTNGGDCVQSWSVVPLTEAELVVIRSQPRQVTKLAFRNLFTTAEKVSLDMASLDDPTAPIAQRQQAAMLRVYLADIVAAEFIDLNFSNTRTSVQMLEGAGLLAAGRALQILAAI